jgi:hypothetical protein
MELHASITFKSINEIKGKSDLPNSYIAKTTTQDRAKQFEEMKRK